MEELFRETPSHGTAVQAILTWLSPDGTSKGMSPNTSSRWTTGKLRDACPVPDDVALGIEFRGHGHKTPTLIRRPQAEICQGRLALVSGWSIAHLHRCG